MNLKEKVFPCMPPLIKEEIIPCSREDNRSLFSGKVCENIVKAYFLFQKINIAEPQVDTGVDLLIEKPEGWVKGQVKKVVYVNKLDYAYKKNFGGEIYRSVFNFNFQSGGGKAPHLKNGRKQHGIETIDYFYHVLLTPYRQLIWETPSSMIKLRKDGSFIQGKTVVIDKEFYPKKKSEINFNKLLIYSQYSPIIFNNYPDFFKNNFST